MNTTGLIVLLLLLLLGAGAVALWFRAEGTPPLVVAPEAVLVELYLSGELAYSLEKIRELGMFAQMDLHSQTSQYGSITRGARYLDLDAALKEKMGAVLEEIRSGKFAEEWSGQQEKAREIFDQIRSVRDQMPMADWERRARAAFRIGGGGD